MSPQEAIPPGRPIDWDLKTILLVVLFLGLVGGFVLVAFRQAWPFLLAGELEGTVEDYVELKKRGLFKKQKRGQGVITCSFREVYTRDGKTYGLFRCRLPDAVWNDPEMKKRYWAGTYPE